ncbi:MAG: hypothetical protein AVDCRST_MAG01-01-4030, partial [uncultured Rubrobacteraceae bacterium]
EYQTGQRPRQDSRRQARVQGDLLPQAHKRRGLGNNYQGGQLHRLRPGRGPKARREV